MERAGRTLLQMAAWLKEQGIEVSEATVSRTMERIRAAAPPLPRIGPPDLEPANDDDELNVIRVLAREEMRGDTWKQRQGGGALLIRLRAEERATRAEKNQKPPEKDGDESGNTWEPPTFGIKRAETPSA